MSPNRERLYRLLKALLRAGLAFLVVGLASAVVAWVQSTPVYSRELGSLVGPFVFLVVLAHGAAGAGGAAAAVFVCSLFWSGTRLWVSPIAGLTATSLATAILFAADAVDPRVGLLVMGSAAALFGSVLFLILAGFFPREGQARPNNALHRTRARDFAR